VNADKPGFTTEMLAFRGWLHRALSAAMARGFTPPIQLVAVGVNGEVLAGHYKSVEGGLELEVTTWFRRPEGFLVPIHMLLCDSASHATVHMVVKRADGECVTVN